MSGSKQQHLQELLQPITSTGLHHSSCPACSQVRHPPPHQGSGTCEIHWLNPLCAPLSSRMRGSIVVRRLAVRSRSCACGRQAMSAVSMLMVPIRRVCCYLLVHRVACMPCAKSVVTCCRTCWLCCPHTTCLQRRAECDRVKVWQVRVGKVQHRVGLRAIRPHCEDDPGNQPADASQTQGPGSTFHTCPTLNPAFCKCASRTAERSP